MEEEEGSHLCSPTRWSLAAYDYDHTDRAGILRKWISIVLNFNEFTFELASRTHGCLVEWSNSKRFLVSHFPFISYFTESPFIHI